MKKITHTYQLSEGDEIYIEKTPKSWTSILNDNYPLRLEFPMKLKIEKIKYVNLSNLMRFAAMTCGNYGWDLHAIIDAGCYLIKDKQNTNIKGTETVDLPDGRYYADWDGYNVYIKLPDWINRPVQVNDGSHIIEKDIIVNIKNKELRIE